MNELKKIPISALFLKAELERIQNEFTLKQNIIKSTPIFSNEYNDYYLQFDEDLRDEANKMSYYYKIFYCLENNIRRLIDDTLKANVDTNWWDTEAVIPKIKDEVRNRIQREKDSGVSLRSEDELDYTTFGELAGIIKTNWDYFGSIFRSKNAIDRVMGNLNLLRNAIAHCTPFLEDEQIRLMLALKDWYRIME